MLKGNVVKIIFASPACTQNGKTVIGKDGDIPWREQIPSDMKRFVTLTARSSLVMGRKTWDSIPEKFQPFDKNISPERARRSIILTRDENFLVNDLRAIVAHSLEEAVKFVKSATIWIIGGAEIYSLALPVADFIHQTIIHERFEGDTFFPKMGMADWKLIYAEHLKAGEIGAEKDTVNSSYLIFERK